MIFHYDREEFGMASISERESREVEAANASGSTPVVFIHGLWLLPSSWAKWADLFKQAGYAPPTPDWRNPNVTEIKKMPNRGHSLTIDHGWQEVAQTALDFVKRFVPATSS
jgi:hypothetical protein